MEKVTKQIWQRNQDGTETLIETLEFDYEGPTTEELIAEKEAKLLEIYTELEALKEK